MKTNGKLATAGLAVAMLATTGAGAATDASDGSGGPSELQALKERVAVLEEANTRRLGSSPLHFSLSNGATVEIYGYVKGDLIYDSNFNLGRTTFGLATLGLPGGPAAGSTTQGQANQSRLGFNITAGDFKAKVEGDFFGAGGGFRLRHAYGEYRGVLVGQTWSNFMPLDSYPSTVDFQGPAGIPFARVPQVRYTYTTASGLSLSASVERDVTGASIGPAFTAAAKYSFSRGSVRVAGITRSIRVGGASITPWGVTVGGTAKLWQGGTLLANYTTGEGISDMLVFGLAGNAQVIGGRTVSANGITLGVSQDIGEQFTVGLAYGRTEISRTLAAADTRRLETVHASVWYKPRQNVKFGVEYFTGSRTQANGARFNADRVQFAGQFSF